MPLIFLWQKLYLLLLNSVYFNLRADAIQFDGDPLP